MQNIFPCFVSVVIMVIIIIIIVSFTVNVIVIITIQFDANRPWAVIEILLHQLASAVYRNTRTHS